MRRFSEAVLLVAFTLLPSLLVKGEDLLPTSNFKPVRRNAAIRGLLIPRQAICDAGFNSCEADGCCPITWNCCSDGNCCEPQTYCALASNGIIGCCDIGKICTGPVGGPTTINGPGPTPTPTLPPPAPLPTTPTSNPVPVPTTPTVAPVPTTPTVAPAPITQTTVNAAPSVASSSQNTATTSKSTGLPIFNAAGQAQLYRPLLVLVGILLAALY